MDKDIRKVDTELLWGLLSDIAALLNVRGYKPDQKNPLFMYWYDEYKVIERELDNRLAMNFDFSED